MSLVTTEMENRTMNLLTALILALSLFASHVGVAQEKPEPESKLVRFYMALLKKGPKWSTEQTKETAELHEQHIAYLTSLLESGQAIISGPIAEDGDLRGIVILRAPSLEDAKLLARDDPTVEDGHLIVEVHPWWAEDVMKKPNAPLKLTPVYLAFLTKGPKWSAADTPENEKLQKAHLANIERLAGMRKLVIAGPFGDNGDRRGIFVFRVGSLEEAQSLCATDPAVKAGHLAVELHQWMVPEGVLP